MRIALFPVILMALAVSADAQNQGPPPLEALSACKAKAGGDPCQFNGRQGREQGSCFAPEGHTLACRPEGDAMQGGLSSRTGQAEPKMREHMAIATDLPLETVPATERAAVKNRFSVKIEGVTRILQGNGIPDHGVGAFPNPGNPNRISPQRYTARIPVHPEANGISPLWNKVFGVALNGVAFDPDAAEFFRGNPGLGWQYEALGGAVPLGLDQSHGHVHPNGAYHYHGLPMLMLRNLGVRPAAHSPQVGWAADGFPIYALYGYLDPEDPQAGIAALQSGYRLKAGDRPGGTRAPGGTHDGAFVQDYEFAGDADGLDECNGRETRTPEFPDGTYAYFLTETWPVIPRCFRGVPSDQFLRKRR